MHGLPKVIIGCFASHTDSTCMYHITLHECCKAIGTTQRQHHTNLHAHECSVQSDLAMHVKKVLLYMFKGCSRHDIVAAACILFYIVW